ncbi:hypothetical protein [Nonomuraea sp. NPDC049750]|uniref:hypothetical protein n=1 Tax=Nonomuraea sp. NPDC049750 TaxID=3154738 RepID=UPI0033FE6256
MLSIRPLIATAMVISATGLMAVPAQAAQQAVPPMLVGIRAAHQVGLDRLVFEFRAGYRPGATSATCPS